MKLWEIYIYVLLIIALNFSLLGGSVSESMVFSPQHVLDGQLWRIVTHPFVHVSLFHLLLDASAFFILYAQLAERSRIKRTFYVVGCGISSMLSVLVVLPRADSFGYCGLSGIGHGLMAVCALELITGVSYDKSAMRLGIICLGSLISKCLYEAFAGKILFAFLYGSLLGCPIAIAHLGGVVGGCILFMTFNGIIPLNFSVFALLKKQLLFLSNKSGDEYNDYRSGKNAI